MCTSYFIDNTKDDLYMVSITRAVSSSGLANRMREKLGRPITTYGRVKPGDIVPVIAPDNKTGMGKVFPMVWGFTGQTQETSAAGSRRRRRTVIASARSEDAVNSRLFGESWERKRCLVPASWYYEWEHLAGPDGKPLKRRYALRPDRQGPVLLTGIYRYEPGEVLPAFAILTRPAAPEIALIHDRMPVICPPDQADRWLDPERDPRWLTEDPDRTAMLSTPDP